MLFCGLVVIFCGNHPDIPDLSPEFQTGTGGRDPGKSAFAVAQQNVPFAGIQASELGQEPKFVTAEDQVGDAVAVQVETLDGIDGR